MLNNLDSDYYWTKSNCFKQFIFVHFSIRCFIRHCTVSKREQKNKELKKG